MYLKICLFSILVFCPIEVLSANLPCPTGFLSSLNHERYTLSSLKKSYEQYGLPKNY